MNACIGAACTQGCDLLGGEFFEGFFQFILDGKTRALALPALIGLTVVGDAQSDSHCKVSVLAVDLTPPRVLRAWGFKSKFKLSALILAGSAVLVLCGAMLADLRRSSEDVKVLKALLVFRL